MKQTHTQQSSTLRSDAAHERVRLLSFGTLVLLAGIGLGVVGGAPRLPDGLPRLDQLTAVLSGSTLPLQALSLVLLDLAWLMWVWIVASLGLELAVVAAAALAHGAGWVHALRRLADRVTFPLARRAVAAAFAVQILSRGVPLAAAQTLTPGDSAFIVETDQPSRPIAVAAAPNAAAQTADAHYLVRPADTLWSIAERAYGSGTAYRRLVDANIGRRMPDGRLFTATGVIQPGWELVIPEPESAANLRVDEVDGERWYTVAAGDTLSSVAAALLGDDSQWHVLFDLNGGVATPDGLHTLTNPNVIWPGLRLLLPPAPPAPPAPGEASEPPTSDLVAASSVQSLARPPTAGASAASVALPPVEVDPLPLVRTLHVLDPVANAPSDVVAPVAGVTAPGGTSAPADADVAVPAAPRSSGMAAAPLALGGGLGLVALAGVALGARRMRRLRPLSHEPETEIVVEGGFAETQLAHDFTRGLLGAGFDPVAALVAQLRRFLDGYNLGHVGIVAIRHGRSATTLTLAAGLAEQPILVDLAPEFASQLDAEAEAWVSADQDVVLRLVRVRKTRLLPAPDAQPDGPCLVPLGVLYDRQVYVATCTSLGHVLIASLPGHGADTILTSLVATLTARRSPEQLRVWMVGGPRSIAAPVFQLPHLARAIDPGDESALMIAADDLRAELDRRALGAPDADLVVVVPELTSLGEHAASFELLASRAASLGVRFVAATSCPEDAALSPLLGHFGTRMVLRMQHEEASVALLGVADAAFLGGGGRLLLRLDGREPVELYGYHVAPEHLERLVRVMRSAYAAAGSGSPPNAPPPPPAADEPPTAPPTPEAELSPPPTAPPIHETPHETATAGAAVSEGPPIQVFCFGGPRVLCAGQQVWPRRPGGDAKPWEFLLYLACQPAEGVSTEDAVEGLWPEDEAATNPGHRFRQLRYRLRHMLAAVEGGPATDGICLERGILSLDAGVIYSDAQEFLGLVHTARINPGLAVIRDLERARELYQGDLLDGPDTRRYAWVDERDDSGVTLREHFRRLFQHASTRLAELYVTSGDLAASIDLYRELTEIDPFDERLWCALFRLHADRGDRLALVREERRFRAALRELAAEVDDDGGVPIDDPSRDTLQEYQRLLAGLQANEREAAAV
ncbi:MAG TPA: LysM peptidoglycan-binding domain-containing protein [Chloroflexota bacterium]|nr:LysM peptidoglycan-binding domain-containing protein [Chloroflexota bacterium]